MTVQEPRYILGIDVGTNSVGSALLDLHAGRIWTGVSVFPAGVEESEDKRGEPKNRKRREARRLRVTLRRRSRRKRALRAILVRSGLLPGDAGEFQRLLKDTDPWELRRRGLDEALSPHEFGRVLLHLAQRRGAFGLRNEDRAESGRVRGGSPPAGCSPWNEDRAESGRVRESVERVRQELVHFRTFGELVVRVRTERTQWSEQSGRRVEIRGPVRNRRKSYEFVPDREMIREEFRRLWETQKGKEGPLASLLTEDLKKSLDDPSGDSDWFNRGVLFAQRRPRWDAGALARCPLHPTDRRVPRADMYASRFLVVDRVNSIRVVEPGGDNRPLTREERDRLLGYLSGEKVPKAVKPRHLRKALGWKDGDPRRLNLESDPDMEIPTDWFEREIVQKAVGRENWERLSEERRSLLNRSILRYDPGISYVREEPAHGTGSGPASAARDPASQLDYCLDRFVGLEKEIRDRVLAAWRNRPSLEDRLALSRRAVRNLLKVMDRPEPDPSCPGGWLNVIQARKRVAGDPDFRDATTGKPLDKHTRSRYERGTVGLVASGRRFLRKHRGCLPPPPVQQNPVVRKSIHEVRRHLEEILSLGIRPDRVCIELSRESRLGAAQANALLKKNRRRDRIRKEILGHFGDTNLSEHQRRAAVDRVLLCIQQGGRCPLCAHKGGSGITPEMAWHGQDCELEHIVPRACGGGDGYSNLILAHARCNREKARRTPRDLWGAEFEKGMEAVEQIYRGRSRLRGPDDRQATGMDLWRLYFGPEEDEAKIAQFRKTVKDLSGMTPAQMAATSHASRQLASYLADALFDGEGLPERGGEQRIFFTRGVWTARFRDEWGLHFGPPGGPAASEETVHSPERGRKDRNDHRHHAVDAVVIALLPLVRQLWDDRERKAAEEGVNTADPEELEAYRRRNRIPVPGAFGAGDFRGAVHNAVYGKDRERPVCHRPAKRKITGALHEESLFGPVPGKNRLAVRRIPVEDLKPAHLRLPAEGASGGTCKKDPTPLRSGLVRDVSLRLRLRECLKEAGLDPDRFSQAQVGEAYDHGFFRQKSGVPIHSVVLLRVIERPVVCRRVRPVHGEMREEPDDHPRSNRIYVGGNNHHMEIREGPDGKWRGKVVSVFEAARRNLERIRAIKSGMDPAEADARHPVVDRRDTPEGRFVMSLCEGETLYIGHEGRDGYFVVAKLDAPNKVVLFPHWDARRATEERDDEGGKIPGSKRKELGRLTARTLQGMGPEGKPHPLKVRVTPLGRVIVLQKD